MNGSDENLCPCEDCERDRQGYRQPNPLGFMFWLVMLTLLGSGVVWRIFHA